MAFLGDESGHGTSIGTNLAVVKGKLGSAMQIGAFAGYDKAFESGLLIGAQVGVDKMFNSKGLFVPLRPRIGYAFNKRIAAGFTPGCKIVIASGGAGAVFMPGAFIEGKLSENLKLGLQYDCTIFPGKNPLLHTVSIGLSYKF